MDSLIALSNMLLNKQRPYISAIIYFLDGIFMLVFYIFMIAPFTIDLKQIKLLKWIDTITIQPYLSFDCMIVRWTFILILAYLFIKFGFKRFDLYLCTYGEEDDIEKRAKKKRILSYKHTLADMLDLLGSFFSTAFLLSTALQYYKNGVLYNTCIAVFIYSVIALKAIFFVAYRFYVKNRKIIDSLEIY